VAADVIVTMKGVAIAELIGLAVSFVADQAAAVLTFGLAEAAEALIIAAAKKCIDYLEQQLEQHIIGAVIEAAINPLVDVVGKAVTGLMFGAVVAGGSGGGDSGVGSGFSVHPEELQARAELMHQQAEKVAAHADEFTARVSGVSFA
jgi:hypothetical protein